MAESESSLGKSLTGDLGATLTDEELVRLLEASELEQRRALEVLESEGGSPREPGLEKWPRPGTGASTVEKASERADTPRTEWNHNIGCAFPYHPKSGDDY
jgi:hypothetical protein